MSDIEDRLAKARERRAEKDKEKEETAQLHELEGLELREKYEAELGEMGKAWFLADTSAGWFVVKLGEKVGWKKWQSAVDRATEEKRPIDAAESAAFVKPCIVFPDEETVKEVYAKFPGLYSSLSGPLTSLHTGKTKVVAGKA